MSTQETPVLTRKVFNPVETHFTPGERSMVAWITCDNVDHEKDVVVTSGVDYKAHFAENPIVLAVHDHGRWPLGKCEWIKSKRNGGFNGLYAKTIFDGDEEAVKVWDKVKGGSLKGISIGFRPPDDFKPGEWGPPTREELARRPDWKGATRIIRRCVLLEYSVCSLPMNPKALVDAVNKGLNPPVYQEAKAMDDDNPEVTSESNSEDKAAEECKCGKDGCDECQARKQAKAEDEEMDEGDDEEDEAPDAESKAMDDEDDEPEPDDDDFDEDDEEDLPIKTRDHVDVKCKGFKGCGMVEKIHRKGFVDHVDEDVVGTKDDPAARVRLYKAHGDGHAPTERRMGVKLSQLTKRAEPFRTPTKKAFTENSPIGEKSDDEVLEPLPAVVVKSDQEVRAELITALKQMLSPEGFRKIAREEAERAAGHV